MRINFEKNIVQTDSRNYTYDDLEDIFTDMETEEYVNVSSRFVKWQKERLVSGLSHFHIFSETIFCIFKGSPDLSQIIFEINGGMRRIRHRTTLNLNDLIFNRF